MNKNRAKQRKIAQVLSVAAGSVLDDALKRVNVEVFTRKESYKRVIIKFDWLCGDVVSVLLPKYTVKDWANKIEKVLIARKNGASIDDFIAVAKQNDIATRRKSLLKIENGMIIDCHNLVKRIETPIGAKRIGRSGFRCKSALREVIISREIEKIHVYSFWADKIESISVREGNTHFRAVDDVLYTFDMRTLRFCAQGKSGVFFVKDCVRDIADAAFAWCKGLKLVVLTDNISRIGKFAFAFSSIEEITIPKSVKSVGKSVFWGCIKLKYIRYAGTLSDWQCIAADVGLFHAPRLESVQCSDGEVKIGKIKR